ncbi:hypothetical protein AAMO2058_001093300 [Amorphochlora amoebiformis]
MKPKTEDPNPNAPSFALSFKANKEPSPVADSGRQSEELKIPKTDQGSSFSKELDVEVLGNTARSQELTDKIEAITRKDVLKTESKKIVATSGLLHNAKVELSQFAMKLKEPVAISLTAVVKKRSHELGRLASKIDHQILIQKSAKIIRTLKNVQEEAIGIQQDLKSVDIQCWSSYLSAIASSVSAKIVDVSMTFTACFFRVKNPMANGVENKRKATIEAYDRVIDHLDQVYKEAAEAIILVNNIRAGLDAVQVALYFSENGWEFKSEKKKELKESLENILNTCDKIEGAW